MSRVLIIEPDIFLSRQYAGVLTDAGYSVSMAADAQAAIQAADTKIPDVIITELKLISHSGIEFLYELRTYPDWQQIPVLVLSSISSTDSGVGGEAWEQLKPIRYLSKSKTTLADLKKAVEIMLGAKAHERTAAV